MNTQYKIEINGDCITSGINRAIAFAKYMGVSNLRIDITEYDITTGYKVEFPIFVGKDSNYCDIYSLYRTKLELEMLKNPIEQIMLSEVQ